MSAHAVAITGMGVVTPIGNGADAFRDALLEGRSGIGPITLFDPFTLPTRIAGEAHVGGEAPFGDRKIAFALEAGRQAMTMASACGSGPMGEGGVSMGVGLELFSLDDLARWRRGGRSLPLSLEARLSFMQTPSDVCVHLLARAHGCTLPPRVHVSACAAGTDALGEAFRRVRSGRARWMIAGGTDSMINPLGVAGFCALKATSARNEEPAKASRPFDRRREGFVMGEGAGVLVLERLDDAHARGAEVLSTISGYGSSLDAWMISDPHPAGRGAHLAMARALEDAGLEARDVDAVNAHGTGTPKNDPAESAALEALLGARAREVPISATKSMIGHCISAAGAIEAVAAVACMRAGMVHPTINLDEPADGCRLDYVPHVARAHPQRHVLSSSYGFGGHNAAVVLSREGSC